MPDKVKEVYDLISDKGYFTDEKEFRTYVEDSSKRKEVFSLIKDDGYFTDEKEFESYFSDVKKNALPNQKPVSQPITPPSEIGGVPTSPLIFTSPSGGEKPKTENLFEEGRLIREKRQAEYDTFKNYEFTQKKLSGIDKRLNSAEIKYTGRIVDPSLKQSLVKEKEELSKKRFDTNIDAKLAYQNVQKELDKTLEGEIKDKGLDYFTRTNESGFKTIDVDKIDQYARNLSMMSGLADEGYFKDLVYNKMKSRVDYEIAKPKIEKTFNELYAKKYGKTPQQDVEQEFKKNFVAQKQIEQQFNLQVASVAKRIKNDANLEFEQIKSTFDPEIQTINQGYQVRANEIQQAANQLNAMAQSGQIAPQEYNANITKLQADLNQLNDGYKQQFNEATTQYLNAQRELNGKYAARYKRQIYELKSMADARLRAEQEKYQKQFKVSPELQKKYTETWAEATDKFTDSEEALKTGLDELKPSAYLFGQSFVSGLGNAIRSLSTSIGYDEGRVIGDYLANMYTLSNPEIKEAKDLLDMTKVLRSSGEMIGGMAPMIAGQTITALATGGLSIPTQLAVQGGLGFTLETAQIGGSMYDETFARTGSANEAEKAATSVMKNNLYLLPLYAVDGLPFIEKATLGVKSTALRGVVKGAVETGTEIPQEFFQSAFEDLARSNKEIKDLGEFITLDRLKNTALNVIPSTFALGATPTYISSIKNKWTEIEAKSLAAKQDLSRLSGTAMQQYMYDMYLRYGENFSKAYLSGLYQSNKIDEAQTAELTKTLDSAKQVLENSNKFKLNKGESKIYASLLFGYEKARAESEAATDDVVKQALTQTANQFKNIASNYLSSKKADFAVIVLPNNEQYVVTLQEANDMLNDESFAAKVRAGEVNISPQSTEKTEEFNSLTNRLKNIADESLRPTDEGRVTTTEERIGEPLESGKGEPTQEDVFIGEKIDDTKDKAGLPSEVGIRQEPIQAEPIQEAGISEIAPSGVLETDEKVTPQAGSVVGEEVESRKIKQLEIINKENPAPNNYNTWVRNLEDIKTADEVFEVAKTEGAIYPDFTEQDMEDALSKGEVVVYSSYPIKNGVFVSPSKMNAQDFAGGKSGKVYSKVVKLEDVAWIDEGQGQYAKVEQSLQSTPQAEEAVSETKPQLEPQIKSNLEKIQEETGTNFREIQNVYTKYGEGKPLNEITVEDYRRAEAKRQAEKEPTEKQIADTATKAGITPKNLRDLYKINRELFGLDRIKSLASAIAMDRMVGVMAKRAGVTKEQMYGRLKFEKDTEANVLKADNALFQGMVDGKPVTLRNMDVDVVNGFYSPLEKIISETKQEKMPAKQWFDKFARGEEAKWTGLQDWLSQQQGSISKQDILNYLKNNRISVVEVVKGAEEKQVKYKQLSDMPNAIYGFAERFIETGDKKFLAEIEKEGYTIHYDNNGEVDYFTKEGKTFVTDTTKFSQYQLEGEKQNYKEVLVTLPRQGKLDDISRTLFDKKYVELNASERVTVKREARSQGLIVDESDVFKSTHFEEPNILVHLRMNTRTDADGKKVLFLEEIQSDWGQTGKKEGFKGQQDLTPIKIEDDRFDNVWSVGNGTIWQDGNVFDVRQGDKIKTFDNYSDAVKWAKDNNQEQNKIPTAPFVMDTNAWVKLGLKVALKEAVAQGVDKIAWTTGEQQNDRYDLSKTIEQVAVIGKNENDGKSKRVTLIPKNGETINMNVSDEGLILTGDYKNNKLEDVIGKELSEKVLKSNDNQKTRFEGNDLKIGGKGMKGFYGSIEEGSKGIVGGVAEKLFGQKVGEVKFSSPKNQEVIDAYNKARSYGNIPDALVEKYEKAKGLESTQPSIDITPALRAEVERGLALFQRQQGQQAKGAMVAADGAFVIYALTDPNVSTPLHEMAHVFEHYLTDAERSTVQEFAGTKSWTTETSEKFARGFEKYLAEGKAPTSGLQKIFDKFKTWLTDIYNGITGSDIDIELNEPMREIYAQMLGAEAVKPAKVEPELDVSEVQTIAEKVIQARDTKRGYDKQGGRPKPTDMKSQREQKAQAILQDIDTQSVEYQNVKAVEENIEDIINDLMNNGSIESTDCVL